MATGIVPVDEVFYPSFHRDGAEDDMNTRVRIMDAWTNIAAAEQEVFGDSLTFHSVEPYLRTLADGWPMASRLTDFVRHRTTCALYHCGTCKAPIDSDIHYVGTVDSHVLTPQTCDCGLSKLLADLHYPAEAK